MLLRESAAGRSLRRGAYILLAAWTESTTRAVLRVPSSDTGVIRTAGIAVVSAAVVHAVLVRSLPAATVGDLPLATNIIVAAGGVAVALCPEQLQSAWGGSSLRRLWKHLHPPR
jgi:hypothetical protein